MRVVVCFNVPDVHELFQYSLHKYDQYTWWHHQMETSSALLAICGGNSPVTGEFPTQRPVTQSLKFSLSCARINGWVSNCEAGDLRRHRTHYGVTVMICTLAVRHCFFYRRLLIKISTCAIQCSELRENKIQYKHIFIFPKINSARQVLGFVMVWCLGVFLLNFPSIVTASECVLLRCWIAQFTHWPLWICEKL